MMSMLQKFAVGLFGLIVVGSPAMARAAGTDDLAQGRALYLQHCAPCHGRSADGNGPDAIAYRCRPQICVSFGRSIKIRCPKTRSPASLMAALMSRLMAHATCRFGVSRSGKTPRATEAGLSSGNQ